MRNLQERCDGSRDTISSTPRSPGHENYNFLNGELRSNKSIVVEPDISPEIETSLLNEQVKSKPSFILNHFYLTVSTSIISTLVSS